MPTIIPTEILIMTDKCRLNLSECPPGHELVRCLQPGYTRCDECDEFKHYQPNYNRGDKCRLKRVCDKPYMDYKTIGLKTTNAVCQCVDGFHFPNEDQRACVPNDICGKGFGQGTYGNCEECLPLDKYSDKVDKHQPCLPLNDCDKQSRCVMKKSNGSVDNVCSNPVKDISMCNSTHREYLRNQSGFWDQEANVGLVVGCAVGAFVLFFVIAVVVLLLLVAGNRKKRRRANAYAQSTDQLEDVRRKVLEKCEKDPAFCKQCIDKSFREIEDSIKRQVWALAQELFRSHYQSGKYEVIVDKYKNTNTKVAVNNYLAEWRQWKGDNSDSLRHLFFCLEQCRPSRPDIIYEICNKLAPDIDGQSGAQRIAHNRAFQLSLTDEILQIMFPCSKQHKDTNSNVEKSNGETTKTLLSESNQFHDIQSRASMPSVTPSPSAPQLPTHVNENEAGPWPLSSPVQATE